MGAFFETATIDIDGVDGDQLSDEVVLNYATISNIELPGYLAVVLHGVWVGAEAGRGEHRRSDPAAADHRGVLHPRQDLRGSGR
jgi:hypothetical protein